MAPVRNPSTTSACALRSAARGFSLIELMAGILILFILLALAAPSFQPIIERFRVRQAVEGLQSTLYYARSEAIKRGGNVVVQQLPTGTNGCTSALTGQDWGCGWFVCADTNGNGSCSAAEPLLQRFDAPTNVDISKTSAGNSISFNRWGLPSTWLGFNFVAKGKSFLSDPSARIVCMSSAGRVRIGSSEDLCNSSSP